MSYHVPLTSSVALDDVLYQGCAHRDHSELWVNIRASHPRRRTYLGVLFLASAPGWSAFSGPRERYIAAQRSTQLPTSAVDLPKLSRGAPRMGTFAVGFGVPFEIVSEQWRRMRSAAHGPRITPRRAHSVANRLSRRLQRQRRARDGSRASVQTGDLEAAKYSLALM